MDKAAVLKKYLIQQYKIVGGASLLLLIGLVLLVSMNSQEQNLKSLAAGSTTIEPENGTLTGNVTVVNDTNASGGKYVRFGSSSPVYYFGTLMTDVPHAEEESNAGVKNAMIEIFWDRYETADGQFNTTYANQVKNDFNALRAAGMQVTLATSLHTPPAWVFTYPNSRFVNQSGATAGEVNLIFNQVLRQKAERYFDRIHQDLGIQNFWAIRLTSGGDAELLYPGGGSYWAYDVNAQNGANMPPSMPRNPYPGWKPGQQTYNGQAFTTSQVGQWADWYVRALANTVDWQRGKFDSLGFRGYYQILTPGSGSRPSYYQNDINNYLPNGITGVGAVWHKLYEYIPRQRTVAYVSSMADHSGSDDSCQTTDRSVPLTSTTANSWSATRWVSRIADEYGLIKNGENVGYNAPPEYNSFYVDTSPNGMMATSFRQMKSCGFQGMYWAHSFRLWDGTVPFSNYAGHISQTNNGANPTPPMPQ